MLAAAALALTWVGYAGVIGMLQGNVRAGIEHAPVIRHIVDDSLGQPFQPPIDGPAGKDSEENSAISGHYLDRFAVSPAGWFEVMKSFGMAEPDSTLADYYGTLPPRNIGTASKKAAPDAAGANDAGTRPVSNDKVPLAMLISDLSTLLQDKTLAGVNAPELVARLAARLGKFGNGFKDAASCWAPGLAQVMADYPGRWPWLTAQLRQPNPWQTPTGKDDCPWEWSPKNSPFQQGYLTGGLWALFGILPSPQSAGSQAWQPWSPYLLKFNNTTPNEAQVARTLFTAFDALNVEKLPAEMKPEAPHEGNIGLGDAMGTNRGTTPSPDVDYLSRPDVKETILAEQFVRQILAAVMKSPDVARPKLWLDMLLGVPQAVLEFFIVLLLVLIAERLRCFLAMRSEMAEVLRWIRDQKNGLQLLSGKLEDRIHAASDVVRILRRAQFKDRLPSGRKIRPRSLAVLMAENAVRRMAVPEPKLEPFREFSAAKRLIVDESAWPLRYLARALPALGFVGTILGILLALNGADGIVRASTQAERVAAMSAVTSPLAFAFSHTLMALSAGLLTGLLIDMLTARERVELLGYEETLASMIDDARRDLADA